MWAALQSDFTCANACSAGPVCNGNGDCALSCPVGQLECIGSCIAPQTDKRYCGAEGPCAGLSPLSGKSLAILQRNCEGTTCPVWFRPGRAALSGTRVATTERRGGSPCTGARPCRVRDRHGNSWSTECDLGGTAKQECNRREGTAWPCFMPHRPSPPTAKQELAGVQRLAWPCHPFLDAKWTSRFFGGPLRWGVHRIATRYRSRRAPMPVRPRECVESCVGPEYAISIGLGFSGPDGSVA